MKNKLPILILLGGAMCLAQACNSGGGEESTTSGPTNIPPTTTTQPVVDIYPISYFESPNYTLIGPSSAKVGDEVAFAIDNIAEGYCLDYFLVNNVKQLTNTFIMPEFHTFVEAVVIHTSEDIYPIEFAETSHGVLATNILEAKPGTEVQIYAQAEKGYRLDKISANGVYLTIKDNTNCNYYTHTIMQNKPLLIEASFVPVEKEFSQYDFVMTGYNGGGLNPAQSYWRFEYKPEGFYVEACVKDEIVFHHPTMSIWQRDNIEMQMSLATDKNRAQDVKALRIILACDGRYAFYRLRSNSAYYALGQNVGYQYGKNFVNEGIICTKDVNGFNGYVVRALFGYDLFDTDYEHALGKITFCPAMRDTISYDESTKTVNEGWKSLTYTMAVENMEGYMNSDFHTEWWVPRSYIGIDSNGKLFDRYLDLDTDLLLVGDSYTMAKRYASMYDDFSDIKISTVGFGNSDTTDWLTDKGVHNGLELVKQVSPRNVALHIGGNDIYLRNKSLDATITNTIDIADRILSDNPNAHLYLLSMVKRVYHPSAKTIAEMNAMVDEYNESMTNYAQAQSRVTLVNITDDLVKDDGNPIEGVFTDRTHLNAFGYAYVTHQLREAMGLPKLSDSERFGSYGKNYATNGFTYEEDGNDTYLRQTNSQKNGNGWFNDRYVYFKNDVNDDFVASANFNISETFNGTDDIKFGFILNDGENQIYFYLNTNEYIVKKYVGIASRIGGVFNYDYVPAIPFNAYFTDNDYTNLKIQRIGTQLKFIVNGYELASLTPSFLKSSYQVGFFSFDVALNVKNPTIELGGND